MQPKAARLVEAPVFESEWPALAQRLRGFLLHRSISPWFCDDIIQETAARLFAMWDRVDPRQPLWPLTVTIALNIVRDEARSRRSRELLGDVPERSSSENVETEGIARIELARVVKALELMDARHRQVLLAEVGQSAPVEGTRGAVKVLRMRARKRLTVLMERASTFGLVILDGMRRLERSAEIVASRVGLTDGRAGAPFAWSMFAALAVVALTPYSQPHRRADQPTDRPRVVEVRQEKRARSDSTSRAGSKDEAVGAGHRSGARSERLSAGDRAAKTKASRPFRQTQGYHVPLGDHGYVSGEVEVELLTGGAGEGESILPPRGSRERIAAPRCFVQVGAVTVEAVCKDPDHSRRRYGARARHRDKSRLREAVLPTERLINNSL